MESLKDLKTVLTSGREDFREPSARVFNGRLWAYGLPRLQRVRRWLLHQERQADGADVQAVARNALD